MFLRREAFERVGLMDEEYFLHCEDLDWCMRFWQAGWKILFVPQVRVVHLKGLSTQFHPVLSEYHKHRGMVRYYNKFFRHQYPAALMGVVRVAVWSRFLAKSGWIMAQKHLPMRHSNRGAPALPLREAQADRNEKPAIMGNG